jgi:fucose permease
VPRRARIAVAVAFFVNGAVVANWVPRIAEVKAELDLSASALGLALLGLPAGAVGALLVAGRLIGRAGSRRVTRLSALALCAALPLVGVAWSGFTLWAALVALGAAAGLMDVAMNTHGVAVEHRYGRSVMASFHGLFSVGAAAGAVIGGAAAYAELDPLAQFAAAAVALGALAWIGTRDLLPAGVDRVSRAEAGHLVNGASLWSVPVLLLGLIAFCSLVGEGSAADWSAVYLRETLGAGPAYAGAGFVAFAAAMAAMRFAGDRLIAQFGPVRVVRVSGTVAALGLGGALLLDDPVAAVAGFGLLGGGLALVVPVTFSAAGRIEGARSIARVAAFGYFGGFAGPPLIGFAADALGSLGAALAIPAVLAGVAAACARGTAPAAEGGTGPATPAGAVAPSA